jgi:hypothetical protein
MRFFQDARELKSVQSNKRIARISRGFISTVLLGVLAFWAMPAKAGFVFSGSAGDRAASARFDTSGSNLILTLSNTATADAMVQVDILTAVFFDFLDSSTNLVLQSVTASGGLGIYQQNSTVNSTADGILDSLTVANLAAPGSTNGGPGSFDGGWQYRENFSGLVGGIDQTRGLGTNGLGIFNGNQVKDVDNQDYALTSAGDDVGTSQAKQLFNIPLIKNSVTFTFSGLPAGFVLTETSVSNVRFQYGTSVSEPFLTASFPPVHAPEPVSLVVWSVLGLAGCGWSRITRRRSRR